MQPYISFISHLPLRHRLISGVNILMSTGNPTLKVEKFHRINFVQFSNELVLVRLLLLINICYYPHSVCHLMKVHRLFLDLMKFPCLLINFKIPDLYLSFRWWKRKRGHWQKVSIHYNKLLMELSVLTKPKQFLLFML